MIENVKNLSFSQETTIILRKTERDTLASLNFTAGCKVSDI